MKNFKNKIMKIKNYLQIIKAVFFYYSSLISEKDCPIIRSRAVSRESLNLFSIIINNFKRISFSSDRFRYCVVKSISVFFSASSISSYTSNNFKIMVSSLSKDFCCFIFSIFIFIYSKMISSFYILFLSR